MKAIKYISAILLIGICLQAISPVWGFFGHRKINRMAVFTLPQDLLPFYKYNIEYVTAHAVDPDKRRYATKHEAARHYIDIDHWGTYPYDNLPREFPHAFLKFGAFFSLSANGDTTPVYLTKYADADFKKSTEGDSLKSIYFQEIAKLRYEDEIKMPSSVLANFIDLPEDSEHIIIEDVLAQYGILPYFLPGYYNRLVTAFKTKNIKRVLQYSADIGHYIGDAHVPLHTTENYNGQLTDQVGIHAFWESRLPELYADTEYDFFVGKAEYIPDVDKFIWKVILDSHALLDEVLDFEKKLSQEFPADQQFCFENRLENTVRIQCEAYSAAYHDKLDGMVEKRMQDAILAIGSIWLSAWVDAGQPDVKELIDIDWTDADKKEEEELNRQFNSRQIKGREHEE